MSILRRAVWPASSRAMVWHQDEPFPTASIFAQWCVMRAAKAQGVTVLLDGQAADELFAGYQPGTYQEHYLELRARSGALALWRFMRARRRATRVPWPVLRREVEECMIHGVTGRLSWKSGTLADSAVDTVARIGIRSDVAAKYLPRTVVAPSEIEKKIADNEGKLRRWQARLGRAKGEERRELERRIGDKRRQIAANRQKLVRLGGEPGRRQWRAVARARRQGLFGHDLRRYLIGQTTSNNLVQLLRYEDRNSMAFSVEARVPFTDHNLVEWAFRRADRYKIYDGWSKWLLRKAMAGRAPREVLWRRDKIGFETPDAGLAKELLDSLGRARWPSESAFLAQFLDARRVGELCAKVEAGEADQEEARLVWRWLVLDEWQRCFAAASGREGGDPPRPNSD